MSPCPYVMLQWLCKSPQYILRLLADGIIFFAFLLPAAQEPSKLPEAANPRKDQPVFFKNFLLSMVLSNLFGKLIMKHINSYLYVLLLAVLHLSAITFKEDFFLFIRVSIFVLFLSVLK